MAATTAYIQNNSGIAKFSDRCYDELSKWGHFKIVSDPRDADVIFQIGSHVQTSRYSGQSRTDAYGNTNTTLSEDSTGFTTISVLDHMANVLWTDTRRWGGLLNGFRSATRDVVRELRKRMEEQQKHEQVPQSC
jgi:hypothetical protein